MSYCRFSNGDVYLYYHCNGFWECCACRLLPLKEYRHNKEFYKKLGAEIPKEDTFLDWQNATFATIRDVYNHLLAHKKAGHEFPKYALQRVKKEMIEYGPNWDGGGGLGEQYCSACGAQLDINDDAWRWNGENWEHKCPGIDSQCGYFVAVRIKPTIITDDSVSPEERQRIERALNGVRETA